MSDILNESKLKEEGIDPDHIKQVYKSLETLEVVDPEILYKDLNLPGLDSAKIRSILDCFEKSGIAKKRDDNTYELNKKIFL